MACHQSETPTAFGQSASASAGGKSQTSVWVFAGSGGIQRPSPVNVETQSIHLSGRGDSGTVLTTRRQAEVVSLQTLGMGTAFGLDSPLLREGQNFVATV
jgi:hypothetical protein